MGNARKDENPGNQGKAEPRCPGKLQAPKEDQDEGRILDEIGLGPHPPEQWLLTAIPDGDLEFEPPTLPRIATVPLQERPVPL